MKNHQNKSVKKAHILIVDDEEHQRHILTDFLKSLGAHPVAVGHGAEALQALSAQGSFDLVISDMQMPEVDGLDLLKRVKAQYPDIDFMIVTAHGTIDSAIEAIRLGASDYLQKPLEFEEVEFRLKRLFQLRQLSRANTALVSENKRLQNLNSSALVYQSSLMQKLIGDLNRVVSSDSTVLLIGETGVGKEVVARHIHDKSERCNGPFIAVNCSAIPENLIESQFFGHEKGAFTGADRRFIGSFETADGGTLFLDEIGEMDLKLQAKILRALEQRQINRLGDHTPIDIDIRVVAATNKPLKQMVAEKTFREDLYYRLNVVQFMIPPLRERKEDIAPLVASFIQKLTKDAYHIEANFVEALMNYNFPGNVRELKNLVERSLLFANNKTLTANCLPLDLVTSAPLTLPLTIKMANRSSDQSLSELVAEFEKQIITDALKEQNGDVELAAKRLKVSRSAFYSKMTKYSVS